MPASSTRADPQRKAADAPPQAGSPMLQLIEQIEELSTLPHIAIRMMQVADDPDAGAVELSSIVQTDPTMTARVLRAVNCAANGLRNKVDDLSRAIAFLGFQRVRNLAVTASVSDIFKEPSQAGAYDRRGLWRHMVSVAVVARMIADRLKLPCANDAFLAGLLHDIGIILEDQYCHEPFAALMTSLKPGTSLPELERRALKCDHCLLGHRLGKQWKFPDPTLDAIRHHHNLKEYRGPHGDALACVDVANFLCSAKGVTSVGVNLLDLPHWSTTRLNLDKEALTELSEAMDGELLLNEALFGL